MVAVARRDEDVAGLQRREQHGAIAAMPEAKTTASPPSRSPSARSQPRPGRVAVAPVERLAPLGRVAGEVERRREHRAGKSGSPSRTGGSPRVHARGAAPARVGAVAEGLGPRAPAAAEDERALVGHRQRRALRVDERHGAGDLVGPVLADLDDDIL